MSFFRSSSFFSRSYCFSLWSWIFFSKARSIWFWTLLSGPGIVYPSLPSKGSVRKLFLASLWLLIGLKGLLRLGVIIRGWICSIWKFFTSSGAYFFSCLSFSKSLFSSSSFLFCSSTYLLRFRIWLSLSLSRWISDSLREGYDFWDFSDFFESDF